MAKRFAVKYWGGAMRRGILLSFATLLMVSIGFQTPASAAASFHNVRATTEGQALLVNFVERGLVPGQNYAYTGSGSVSETFQCYRSRTFTPLPRTLTVNGQASPDVRAYTADANGVVRGFIYLWPDFSWPDFCHGQQSVVAIGVCYHPATLIDFVEPFDVYWFADGTEVCGAVEPD